MKKNFRNSLLMLVAGTFAAACADYNVTDNFKADPDPSYVETYADLAPVKSYINRTQYPNLTLGAQLKVSDFNNQELAHAAAITNFDNVAFGTTLMAGKIVNEKGVMNFLDMKDLLDHVQEINGEVFGSPLFANANQADAWMKMLTSPIEIPVDFEGIDTVDFNTWPVGNYTGTKDKGNATIVSYDDRNCLKIAQGASIRIIEGFALDSLARYTTTFWAKVDKDATFTATFSDVTITNKHSTSFSSDGKITLKAGKWTKVVVEAPCDPHLVDSVGFGYFRIENLRNAPIHVERVQIGFYPDNHRPQTDQERIDTIHYAINTWCDGLMKINEGRIKSFDLIDEAIDPKAELESEAGILDLKHSTDANKIFWQDVLGSNDYAPFVSQVAADAFARYEGNPDELKFFISEVGLEDQKKFNSLKYWIGVWDARGAKIDGINAKLTLTYSEDPTTQAANEAAVDKLLENLAALANEGKLIRLSNFDIKYQDATGASVVASKITDDQRQQLANFYGYVIRKYMNTIPHAMQAGICKGNMADTTDPVGLWSVNSKNDWVRTATYEAFCKALSGE